MEIAAAVNTLYFISRNCTLSDSHSKDVLLLSGVMLELEVIIWSASSLLSKTQPVCSFARACQALV